MNNQHNQWESLYDKYSPIMYGLILKLIPEEKIALKILEGAFVQLKTKNIIDNDNYVQCSCILKNTYNYAIVELKSRNIIPQTEAIVRDTLIHIMCTGPIAINRSGAGKSLNESEFRKNLRAEIMLLRNKKSKKLSTINNLNKAESFHSLSN